MNSEKWYRPDNWSVIPAVQQDDILMAGPLFHARVVDGAISVSDDSGIWREPTPEERAIVTGFLAEPRRHERTMQPEFEVPDTSGMTDAAKLDVLRAFLERMDEDSRGSRWGLHGRGAVDDDYFDALAYVVGRARRIIGHQE